MLLVLGGWAQARGPLPCMAHVHTPAQNANGTLRGNTDLANALEEDVYVPIYIAVICVFLH